MSRSAVRVILGIVLALVIVVGVGGALVWWKIAGLKERLAQNLEDAIGAQVQVSSIDLDVWKGELHAAGISLTNERPDAPWEKGDISQATVRFQWSDLFAPTLPVSVDVSSWNIVLRNPSPHPGTSPILPSPEAMGESATSPPRKSRIQVNQISAQDGTVEFDLSADRKIVAHGVDFQSADNGAGIWNTQLHATSLTAGSLQAGPSSVEIRGEPDKVTFSNLRMQCDPGAITGEGELALDGNHAARIDLKAIEVPVTMLVAVEWQMKISGLAGGDLHYESNDASAFANGHLSVDHGKFNVAPWLGKITSMVGLADISDVELDRATCDFAWKDHIFHLTNLDLRKNDVTRIAGNVDIDSTGQVDGQVKLGLPSAVTGKWPQLQDKVFPVQMEDYNWAEVHVTGTSDHLEEDLTPRLLAVGLGQGTDLLNQATQKASDLINNLIGK